MFRKYFFRFALPSVAVAAVTFIFLIKIYDKATLLKSKSSSFGSSITSDTIDNINTDNSNKFGGETLWRGYRLLLIERGFISKAIKSDSETLRAVASCLKDSSIKDYISIDNQSIPITKDYNTDSLMAETLIKNYSPFIKSNNKTLLKNLTYLKARNGYFFDKENKYLIYYISSKYDKTSFDTLSKSLKSSGLNIILESARPPTSSIKNRPSFSIPLISSTLLIPSTPLIPLIPSIPSISVVISLVVIYSLIFLVVTIIRNHAWSFSAFITYSLCVLFFLSVQSTFTAVAAVFLIYLSSIILRLQKFAQSRTSSDAFSLFIKTKRVWVFFLASLVLSILSGSVAAVLYFLLLVALGATFYLVKSLKALKARGSFQFVSIAAIKPTKKEIMPLVLVTAYSLLILVFSLPRLYSQSSGETFVSQNDSKSPLVPAARPLLEGEEREDALPTFFDFVRFRFFSLTAPFVRLKEDGGESVRLGCEVHFPRYKKIGGRVVKKDQIFSFNNDFISETVELAKSLNTSSIERLLCENYSALSAVAYLPIY